MEDYNYNHKGFDVRILEIVREFEGNIPKIVTLKLYIDGNYRGEKTFLNNPYSYKRNVGIIRKMVAGYALGMSQKNRRYNKHGNATKIF
jgi:hypothetical protein